MSSPTDAMTNPNHTLREQLERIVLRAVPSQLDDMLARATQQRWSPRQLLEQLERQTPEGRLRKLRAYANVALLCIDEVGYLSFDDKSADLLYEVIDRRYEQKSLIFTTNKPFKEWNEVFPNAAYIATLLDRLLHHAEVTVIEGSSYRVRESEQETTVRRRRKNEPPQCFSLICGLGCHPLS